MDYKEERKFEIVWHLEEAERILDDLLSEYMQAVIISKDDVRLQALQKQADNLKTETLLLIEEELE